MLNMHDANIVTLCENKGDRSDCSNYMGISLLSIAGKVFASVAFDLLISLRQIQEKSRDQRKSFYVAFIDFTKAFDLVSKRGLFALLEKIGCPESC